MSRFACNNSRRLFSKSVSTYNYKTGHPWLYKFIANQKNLRNFVLSMHSYHIMPQMGLQSSSSSILFQKTLNMPCLTKKTIPICFTISAIGGAYLFLFEIEFRKNFTQLCTNLYSGKDCIGLHCCEMQLLKNVIKIIFRWDLTEWFTRGK